MASQWYQFYCDIRTYLTFCCVCTDFSFETHWTEIMYIATEMQNKHIIGNAYLDLIFKLK